MEDTCHIVYYPRFIACFLKLIGSGTSLRRLQGSGRRFYSSPVSLCFAAALPVNIPTPNNTALAGLIRDPLATADLQ